MDNSTPPNNQKLTITPLSNDLEQTSVHTVKTDPAQLYPRAADDLSDLQPQTRQPLTDDQHIELGRALLTRGGDTDTLKHTVKRIAIVLSILALIGLSITIKNIITEGVYPMILFDIALNGALLWSTHGLYRFHEFARMLCYIFLGIIAVSSLFTITAAVFAPVAEMPTSERVLLLFFIASFGYSVWAFAYLGRRDVRRLFA